jgi:hypothetical protein
MDLYCYDFHGVYLGRLDGEGTFFDAGGDRRARVLDCGDVYDFDGCYLGRINAQGSYFGADGICRGYVRDWMAPAVHSSGATAPAILWLTSA